MQLAIEGSSGKLRFKENGPLSWLYGNRVNWSKNKWYHIAATWGPNGRHIYVDGVEEASDNKIHNAALSYNTWIGNHPYTQGVNPNEYPAYGYIDEVKISDVQYSSFNTCSYQVEYNSTECGYKPKKKKGILYWLLYKYFRG